jgi:hypothetical protein
MNKVQGPEARNAKLVSFEMSQLGHFTGKLRISGSKPAFRTALS